MQNEIAYSRPVTLTNILRFAVPTIAMSVFMSFYTMVDGLFVSNLIGTSALSALNLVYPGSRAGDGHLHHARNRRQRGYHEKDGRGKAR